MVHPWDFVIHSLKRPHVARFPFGHCVSATFTISKMTELEMIRFYDEHT